MATNLAIGIDLGTTYSCVGVFRNGKVEIICNEQGNVTTPSYVSFNDVERLVGDAAKNELPLNPENTVFDAKRLIGRRFDDANVQKDMKHWPFKVINDNGKPKIEVEYKKVKKTLYPEEVSSMVLAKMKEIAESYLGRKIKDAVITVPAYFNDAQRYATKDAGEIAGLNVLRIISEPTAAAVAFGLDRKIEGLRERNVLVYDLGGGTFDVSVLTINGGTVHIKATSGDTHLGGEDFDNRLIRYLVEDFKKKYKKDLSTDKRALARLKRASERAKRSLASTTVARIAIDSIWNGKDYEISITRALFENLNADLFRSTLEPVKKAMKDAGMEKGDIHDVVLIGGSTRIPKVQKLLQDFFDGRELYKTINPDEAVAYGATLLAAKLTGHISPEMGELVLFDVTPLSLGVNTVGGVMGRVVKRNTRIPLRRFMTFTTASDNKTTQCFEVYEGEQLNNKENNLLGSFILNGIRPAPANVPELDVTFDIDINGILKVTAVDRSTGSLNSITITNDRERLTADQIKQMIAEAEINRAEDEKRREDVSARNELEAYCFDARDFVAGGDLSENDKEMVCGKCNDALVWIDKESPDAARCRRKLTELKAVFDPIIQTSSN